METSTTENTESIEFTADVEAALSESTLHAEQEVSEDQEGSNSEDTQGEVTLPLSAALSALLFSSSRGLSISQLKKITKRSEDELTFAIAELEGMYFEEVHGFSLQFVSGNYQFRSAPAAAPWIREIAPKKTKRLSKAAAETLAVIAYKQPVQRAEIEAIRGVDALPTLKTLLDMRLVRIVGQDSSIGHPALYGTTELFLERFGLPDLESLPSERELTEIEQEVGEIDEDSSEDQTA